MHKKIVIIGAGQTGRGFIGRLLKQSGQLFDFIDSRKELVSWLNMEKQYKVSFYDSEEGEILVNGFRAFCTDDEEAVKVLSEADIVFTSIGEQNLHSIVPLINESLKIRKGQEKLVIVTCENGTSPKSKLSSLEGRALLSESIIFCTTLQKDENSLDILSQNIDYLPYDLEPLKEPLNYHGMVPVSNFRDLLRRKIYTYNCLSAAIAYPGYYKGYKSYGEAANDKDIIRITDLISENLNYCISREFNVGFKEQQQFTSMALSKFRDRNIIDSIERNVRDVERKLGRSERMITPILLMRKYSRPVKLMELVIACAVYYGCHNSEDKKTEKELLIKNIGQLLPADMIVEIEGLYEDLAVKRNLSDIIDNFI